MRPFITNWRGFSQKAATNNTKRTKAERECHPKRVGDLTEKNIC
jgi:hypothetical protein